MTRLGPMPQNHGHRASCPGVWTGRRWLYDRLASGVIFAGLTSAQTAWGARGTAFRGQWSLGSLIGSLAIVGVLAALILFLVWPRRGGE